MNIDTIAAIATAQGQGGIGIIRVSGPESIDIVEKIFKSISKKTLQETPGYKARFGKIHDNDEDIDECVVLVFRAPNSYTGENVVEISCHGGLYITKRILRLVLKNGARPAEPGEFTKRAFLNGKMDLIKAESVMKIIGATGKGAARAALAVHEGAISKKILTVKDTLVNLAAHLSVWADYPEDDIPDVEFNSIKENIISSKDTLNLLIKNYDTGKAIVNGIDTAIVGAPNVGKSTLMNMMSGAERSIVTDIPGTTRDIVEESIILGDISLHISDTAGIRNTNDPVESIGVDKAKNRLNSAELVLLVFDGSKELTSDDKLLINSINENNVIAIINKSDLEQHLDCEYIKDFVKEIVYISAKNGIGLEKLEEKISNVIGTDKVDPSEGILASERQCVTIRKAIDSLNEALDALSIGLTLDAVTVSVESAIDELLTLTGEKATQVVVDEVFSKFCVGK